MAITSARATYAYDNKLAGMAAPTFASGSVQRRAYSAKEGHTKFIRVDSAAERGAM
jgi:hypothetical protein